MTKVTQQELEQMDKDFDRYKLRVNDLEKALQAFIDCRGLNGKPMEPLFERAYINASKLLGRETIDDIDGKRLRALRTGNALTQVQLAEKMGVKRGTVNFWEMGKLNLSHARKKQIAEIFKEGS